MIAQILATLTHIPILRFLLQYYNPDDLVFGIGLATSISSFIKLLFIFVIGLVSNDVRQSYFNPLLVICSSNDESYSNFVSIDLPSMAMFCAEGWALQLLTIFAGYLSDEAQAVQGAFAVISSIVIMLG